MTLKKKIKTLKITLKMRQMTPNDPKFDFKKSLDFFFLKRGHNTAYIGPPPQKFPTEVDQIQLSWSELVGIGRNLGWAGPGWAGPGRAGPGRATQ